jgi:hypothetical protein
LFAAITRRSLTNSITALVTVIPGWVNITVGEVVAVPVKAFLLTSILPEVVSLVTQKAVVPSSHIANTGSSEPAL